MLLSCATTEGIGYVDGRTRGMKLEFIDVRRAYYHAPAIREVYVSLPPEDAEEGIPEMPLKTGKQHTPRCW